MSNLPTIRQLTYLSALEKHRHFRVAAESCFISQSALSSAISELEQNLKVKLFEREASIRPTAVGEKLVQQARDILEDLDNFVEYARQTRGDFCTDLQLGVIPTIAPFLLPSVLGTISARYKPHAVFIREDLSPNLLQLLHRGDLDLLLFAFPYDVDGFHCELLVEDPLLLCTPADHPLAGHKNVSIDELSQHQLLMMEDGHCLREQVLSACKLDIKQLRVPFQATSLNTLVQMIATGIGISLLPQMAVDANVMQSANVVIRPLVGKSSMSRQIGLVWRKNSPRINEFRQIASILKENIIANRQAAK